ncbi:MAG TPA: FG-GAP-like repeat-containing protein [Candidatus Competibacter sp.]|nr:FG-GAP-like repeat-containing protein [Candidatus Competibacter sp.]
MAVNGATGAIKWHASSPGGSRLWPGIVVADLDNNGSLEIVTGDGSGYISVYTGNGTNYPGWPIQPTGTSNEIRSLAVADIDGDGDKEIVVCSTRADNQWFVYEHTGTLRSGWPKMTDSDTNGYAAGCYNENVGVADLDGDGRGEIIGPNDTHYIAAFNDDGSPVRANAIYGTVGGQNKPWARVGVHVDHAVDLRGYANCGTEHRPNFANSAPTIADVNGDGMLEVIVVGNVYNCGTDPYTDLYEMPFIFKADRRRWSGNGFDWTAIPIPDANAAPLTENYSIIENNVPNPVIADLDGNGYKEILYPSYDGRLHAYWLDKTEKYNWPFEVYAGGAYRFASEPLVADLDGDGKAEVIFTTWTQKGSNQRGDLKIVNWQGTQLFSVQLPASSQDWDGALPAPALANIDGDADLEILIGSAHAGLLAYDLPGTSNATVLWGTGRGSFQRTGQALKSSSARSHSLRGYDFDGDGKDDLAGLNANGTIYYSTNKTNWTHINGTLAKLVAGDFDGDGKDDLAGLNANGTIYYSTNKTNWTRINGTLSQLVAGDFDGDGKDDLAGLNANGTIYYSTNKTNWTHINGTLAKLVAGDFDGDGKDDLAGLNANGTIYYSTNKTNWTRINGTLSQLVAGDFDGDGKDDLAGLNANGTIYYSTNKTNWTHINGTLAKLVAGDFDGDGKDDLAGLNASGAIYYSTNKTSWIRINGSLTRLTSGNYNGDLYDDLAGLNSAGNIYYSTGLNAWIRIPGQLSRLAGDME